jgi:hypothetical protein
MIGSVNYVDFAEATWPKGNFYWPFAHKRLGFEHEQEVRALAGELAIEGDTPSEEKPVSRYFGVDLEVLIDEIVISPVAPAWLAELITAVGAKYKLHAVPRQSELAGVPLYGGEAPRPSADSNSNP